MAQDLERLERALVNADQAGDTEAATRIAQEIRSRRATGPQAQRPAPTGPAPVAQPQPVEADPFEGAPTQINGVELMPDEREALLAARQIKDPKERRIFAARLSGRLAKRSEGGNLADKINRSQFGAGLRGFGTGIFGLGDVAAAGGTFLSGLGEENSMSFGEALEAQREFRRALEEDFPITSGLSEIAGALTGGGVAAKALTSTVRAGTTGRRALEAATKFQRGQRGRNLLRASGLGATTGAITEGISEGEAGRGAAEGAVGGALGLGLVRAGQVTVQAARKLLEGPAGRSIRLLADKIGEKPGEIARRFLEFEAATGKKPTIADLANNQAVAELRDMIAERTGAERIVGEAAESALRRRAGEFGEEVAGGRVTTTGGRQRQVRDVVARRQFGDVEDQSFTFQPEEVKDLLLDADLRRGIPRTLRRRIDEALDAAGEDSPVELTGLDVNDIRVALRQRAKGAVGADRVFGELADEVEDIARSQSDEFGRAIDEFAQRSRRAEGVEAGRRGVTQPTSEFRQIAREAEAGNELAALRVGARSGLADVATEAPSRARAVAESLSQDSGLVRRLKEVLDPKEIDRLQQLGAARLRSFRNIDQLSPTAKARAEEGLRDLVGTAADAIVAASPATSAASKVFSFARGIRRLLPGGVSDRVVENMARDIFDPSKTGQVITALRRAKVSDDDILELLITASTVGGQATASE